MKENKTKNRYILITQCLQNDFLKDKNCKLRIDDEEINRLLYGETEEEKREVKQGPLYCFLENTLGEKNKSENLYVIHIRDHHKPSNNNYQHELMKYGRHCEIDTHGWEFFEGPDGEFKELFKIDNKHENGKKFQPKNEDRIFEARSTSIHDFKPERSLTNSKKIESSRLEEILDYLIPEDPEATINILVIGVYTDIKVKILVTDLRTRFDNVKIAVASSLTASRSIA